MKVTLKNTRILFYAGIANILVCGLIFFFLFEGINTWFINILLLEYFLFMVITLVYFIRTLIHFNEATAIVAAFTMFTGVLTISIINTVFPRLLRADYSHWLSTLAEVISLLVAFRSFFVKTRAVSLPFKLFGTGVGLVVIPRLYLQLVATSFSEALLSVTGDLGVLVILLATCFILKRMMDVLKDGAGQAVEAVEDLL